MTAARKSTSFPHTSADMELAAEREPVVTFSRPTDGTGHRPRWTRREEQNHKLLEMSFREWAEGHGVIWFDKDSELADAIADVLDIKLVWL